MTKKIKYIPFEGNWVGHYQL